MFSESDLVFSYTTKDAVRDGILIPIAGIISGCLGINVPVYFNDSVWTNYVAILKEEYRTKRISVILTQFAVRARTCNHRTMKFSVDLFIGLDYKLLSNEVSTDDPDVRTVNLKAIIDAHDMDDPSPAIFIMLPWED
jgi:hypothetical protein